MSKQGAGNFGQTGDWELELGDGKKLSSKDWAGKVVIVDFWATWCGPCVSEIPEFVELQKKHAEDLRIVGVSYDKEEEAQQKFLRDQNVNYPSVLAGTDSGKKFVRQLTRKGRRYQGDSVTLLVNRKGEIVFRQAGVIGPEFHKALQEALAAK